MKVIHRPVSSAHISVNTAETQGFYHSKRVLQESWRWLDAPGDDGSLRGPKLRQIRAEALQFASGPIHGDSGGGTVAHQPEPSVGGRTLISGTLHIRGTQLPATPIGL